MSGKFIRALLVMSITVGLLNLSVYGGQSGSQSPSPNVRVPQLISISGALKERSGRPITGVTSLKLALYKDQEGGMPTWVENQNATLDEQGRYSVMLGAVAGLPVDLFTSGEQRWLGVQANVSGEEEQPRLLFVSVPYALKSSDADTLGGRPASAYSLRTDDGSKQSNAAPSSSGTDSVYVSQANSGNAGYLGMFVNSVDLQNSNVFQNGNYVGIGTNAAAALLHVKGPAATWTGNFVIESGPNEVQSMTFMDGPTGGPNTLGLLKYDGNTKELLLQNYNGGAGGNVRLQAGTGALMVANGGQTGIGTTSPAAMLHVKGNPAIWTGNMVIESDPGQVQSMTFMDGPTGGPNTLGLLKYDGNTKEMLYQNYNGGVGGDIRLQAGTGALFVKNGGSVGIGTLTPTVPLDVNGAVKSSSTVTGSQLVSNVATGTPPLAVASTTVVPNLNASLLGGLAANAFAPSSVTNAALTRGVTYLAGCDTCSVLADTDDQKTIYFNVVGAMTVNSVLCVADAGSPTIQLRRDDGSPANILSGNLTCDGTPTTSFVGGESVLNLNEKVDFELVSAGGVAKRITVIVKLTVN